MIPETRIVIVNEVLDTRQELVLPETPDEAMKNCLVLETARRWSEWHTDDNEPLAVCIVKRQQEIMVRWYVVGDPVTAREEMVAVQNGTWEEGLLS